MSLATTIAICVLRRRLERATDPYDRRQLAVALDAYRLAASSTDADMAAALADLHAALQRDPPDGD